MQNVYRETILQKKYLTRIMSMSHWAKVDILHYKTDFIKIFLQGKFWQFQSFIPYNLNTLHMYVFFSFQFNIQSYIISLKFKNAIQKNGYGGKDKHLQMRLIFSFSQLKKCIKDKIPSLFSITKSTMFASISWKNTQEPPQISRGGPK